MAAPEKKEEESFSWGNRSMFSKSVLLAVTRLFEYSIKNPPIMQSGIQIDSIAFAEYSQESISRHRATDHTVILTSPIPFLRLQCNPDEFVHRTDASRKGNRYPAFFLNTIL